MKRCSLKQLDMVHSILSDDKVFDQIGDDSSSDKSHLKNLIRQLLTSVSVYVLNPIPGLLLMFFPQNGVTYDIHIASTVKNVRTASKDAVVWMAENTKAEKFTTHVPVYNKAAALFARRCGLKKEGHLKKAIKKNGLLHDVEIYGITKEEIEEVLRCQY